MATRWSWKVSAPSGSLAWTRQKRLTRDNPVQYFGREASDFTKQLATGKRVRLEFDQDRTDRYGRTLAYVYLQPENLLLNAEIIRQGYGFAYTQFPFRMMADFRALEGEAREAGRGLWAAR
jgi:micrococcal nuclease